jgi:membrane-bound lytic murein transglycosylase B
MMTILRFLSLCALLSLLSSAPAHAEEDFDAWLAAFKSEAAAGGLDPLMLNQALADIRPIDKVLELDRRQPEFTLSFADYMAHVASPARQQEGKKRLAQNRATLERIAKQHGVPPQFIVAMWGIESDYGRVTGSTPVLAALVTLAYDGRRSRYFRGELIKALTMVAHGVPPLHMQGSWAGAMGQCQFMPSTYLAYAQSDGGQAPADIWSRPEDVWASTANYLAGLQWQSGQPWGMAVKLPRRGIAAPLFGLDHPRGLQDWKRLGIKRGDGGKLGDSDVKMALIHVDGGKDGSGGEGPVYLVGDNFRALLHWNRSFFFAIAAGTLADRIGSR